MNHYLIHLHLQIENWREPSGGFPIKLFFSDLALPPLAPSSSSCPDWLGSTKNRGILPDGNHKEGAHNDESKKKREFFLEINLLFYPLPEVKVQWIDYNFSQFSFSSRILKKFIFQVILCSNSSKVCILQTFLMNWKASMLRQLPQKHCFNLNVDGVEEENLVHPARITGVFRTETNTNF